MHEMLIPQQISIQVASRRWHQGGSKTCKQPVLSQLLSVTEYAHIVAIHTCSVHVYTHFCLSCCITVCEMYCNIQYIHDWLSGYLFIQNGLCSGGSIQFSFYCWQWNSYKFINKHVHIKGSARSKQKSIMSINNI